MSLCSGYGAAIVFYFSLVKCKLYCNLSHGYKKELYFICIMDYPMLSRIFPRIFLVKKPQCKQNTIRPCIFPHHRNMYQSLFNVVNQKRNSLKCHLAISRENNDQKQFQIDSQNKISKSLWKCAGCHNEIWTAENRTQNNCCFPTFQRFIEYLAPGGHQIQRVFHTYNGCYISDLRFAIWIAYRLLIG